MSERSANSLSAIKSWLNQSSLPFIISGPCSVETPDQLLETAIGLRDTQKVDVLRGGIWKPRTRPNSFEGIGEPGLKWMQEVKKETGMAIMTEVATAEHVELCLKHDVDMLWVGARTTVNPFSVQEIADALRGVDIPVFVKNPVNPDLQLWIGALERIQGAGITKLAAIHRGFSIHGSSIYRNKPMWEIPIALRSLFPNIDIVCDPSHICGRRDLLHQVAQRAMDLGFNGLMIESHRSPDDAWSDAEQQLTPVAFAKLIDSLQFRKSNPSDLTVSNDLQSLRSKIDKIDEEIITLISDRMKITEEIGHYKKQHDITIFQLERWQEIMSTRSQLAAKLGLTEEFITIYLEQLHKESIRTQTRVMSGRQPDREA